NAKRKKGRLFALKNIESYTLSPKLLKTNNAVVTISNISIRLEIISISGELWITPFKEFKKLKDLNHNTNHMRM
ncbi:unnamed protein product, partial [marine sediment metagenome]